MLEGRLQHDSWEDRETGQKRYKTTVVANTVNFLGSRNDADAISEVAPVDFQEIAQTQVGLARQQAMTMMVISRFENHRSVKQLLC